MFDFHHLTIFCPASIFSASAGWDLIQRRLFLKGNFILSEICSSVVLHHGHYIFTTMSNIQVGLSCSRGMLSFLFFYPCLSHCRSLRSSAFIYWSCFSSNFSTPTLKHRYYTWHITASGGLRCMSSCLSFCLYTVNY